jgi:hypothetical protein
MLVTLAAVLPALVAAGLGLWNWRHPPTVLLPLPLCCGQSTRRPLPQGLFYLPSLTSRSSASFACTTVQQGRCPLAAVVHGLLIWCIASNFVSLARICPWVRRHRIPLDKRCAIYSGQSNEFSSPCRNHCARA